jgi:hypothetical protein
MTGLLLQQTYATGHRAQSASESFPALNMALACVIVFSNVKYKHMCRFICYFDVKAKVINVQTPLLHTTFFLFLRSLVQDVY